MTLQKPKINELKTELVAVLDYIQPSIPTSDGENVLQLESSVNGQSDEVRSALAANMFVEILSKIGNTTPSEIEVSARIIREIVRLLEQYESLVSQATNLVEGDESLVNSLRARLIEITENEFPGIPSISSDTSETAISLLFAILSPFYPKARMLASATSSLYSFDDILNGIWGSLESSSTIEKPNLLSKDTYYQLSEIDYSLVIRDVPETEVVQFFSADGFNVVNSNQEEILAQYRRILTELTIGTGPYIPISIIYDIQQYQFINIALDYLSQWKAIAKNYPEFINSQISAHSKLFSQGISSNDIGIVKNILLDKTTSKCKKIRTDVTSPTLRTKVDTLVTTDDGIARTLDIFGATFEQNKTKITDYINVPENVLRQDVISTLRDGFILDTEMALERGIPGATKSVINNDKYKNITESIRNERSDIINKMQEIIASSSSDLVQGRNGDFVPGLTDESLLSNGSGFNSCKFLAIPNGLSYALTPKNCISLALLITKYKDSFEENFFGSRILFGEDWIKRSIQSISKIFIFAKIQSLNLSFETLEENLTNAERIRSSRIRAYRRTLDELNDRLENLERTVERLALVEFNNQARRDNAERVTLDIYRQRVRRGFQEEIDFINSEIDETQRKINDELSSVLDENYQSIVQNNIYRELSTNFPYSNAFKGDISLRQEVDASSVRTLLDVTNIVGFQENLPLTINKASKIDPYFKNAVESGEVLSNQFIDAIDSVLINLSKEIIKNINSFGINIDDKDFANYAYMYLMLASSLSKSVFVKNSRSDIELDSFADFNNRCLGINGGVIALINTPQIRINYAKLDSNYAKNINNTIGFGENAPQGFSVDTYSSSLKYVKTINDTISNLIPNSFYLVSEAIAVGSKALRKSFAQNIVVNVNDTQIPINILDYLLQTTNFRELAALSKDFADKKTLLPILLLSSDDIESSFNILQFALYALTQSPLTRLTNTTIGNFSVPYNKVGVVGIHKELSNLIDLLPNDSVNYQELKKGKATFKMYERQFEPSPSTLDQIASEDPLYRGTRFLQSIESNGQPINGFKIYLKSRLDYSLIKKFTTSIPSVRFFYKTKNVYGREVETSFELNLSGINNDSIPQEEIEYAINFIRSEALKIYYYYMSGMIFQQEFMIDPEKDDSLLTEDLISANPIVRLISLFRVFSSNENLIFSNVFLFPFISDNDSIEEFTGILRLQN